MSIYKPCDIRGNAASELTPDLYRNWGYILGLRLPSGSPFAAGGDVRNSTPAFLDTLIDGLCRAGMRVLDLGVVPTPMAYFAMRHLKTSGCAIVTASHSPSPVNGLKWMVGSLPPSEDDVQALKRDTEMGDLGPGRSGGSRQALDINPAYVAWLKNRWAQEEDRVKAHVILDPGNGAWSGRACPYLQAVFPNANLTAIHDRPDGSFPDRNPDSAKPAHLTTLAQTVRTAGADLGVAFDGDGDRVAFVDGKGQVLSAEETTWILLHSFEENLQGRPFVYDVKFSDRIPEAAAHLGARPQAQRSGHAFIRTRMIENDGYFGAEISGHYFYGDLQGGDDGLYTACRILVHISETGRTLADLRRDCPKIHMTPDLRLPVETDRQDQVIQQIRDVFQHRPQKTVDGIRIDFPNGWALVRKSVTEPKLSFRFEGNSAEDLDRVVTEFCNDLPGLGQELLGQVEGKRKGTT